MFESLKKTYQESWKILLRPPRYDYSPNMIGPYKFVVSKVPVLHLKYTIQNSKGHQLACSHIIPEENFSNTEPLPCVIYAHSHAGNRLEGNFLVNALIPKKISVFLFDFSGSGQSTDQYVTLGHYEQDDLSAVIQHLQKLAYVSHIGIWGRSMGASTAIMSAWKHKAISAMVLDSPFSSLVEMIKIFITSKLKIPGILLGPAIDFLGSQVEKEAGINIKKIEPGVLLKNNYIPTYFVVGNDDNLTSVDIVKQMYFDSKGEKMFQIIQGDHKSCRQPEFINDALKFLLNKFGMERKKLSSMKLNMSSVFSPRDGSKKIFDFSGAIKQNDILTASMPQQELLKYIKSGNSNNKAHNLNESSIPTKKKSHHSKEVTINLFRPGVTQSIERMRSADINNRHSEDRSNHTNSNFIKQERVPMVIKNSYENITKTYDTHANSELNTHKRGKVNSRYQGSYEAKENRVKKLQSNKNEKIATTDNTFVHYQKNQQQN